MLIYGSLWLTVGIIVMPDTTKFKSVGVDLTTYQKLIKLSEDEHRNVRQQIAKLTADAFDKKYGQGGIGSAAVNA
jgi:ferritin